MKRLMILLGTALLGVSVATNAATVYDEFVSGEISDDPTAPTDLGTLAVGVSSVVGVVGPGSPFDQDYLTFAIAPNNLLTGINLEDYSAGNDLSFIGLYAGDTSPTPPGSSPVFGDLLGGAHINGAMVGTDIFPQIENFFGFDNFDRPLGPGDYTLLVQQTGGIRTAYSVGMVVTPIPAALPLLLSGFAVLGFVARRKRAA